MLDHAVAGRATFVFRYVPGLGSGGAQHVARGSTGFAQRIPGAADAHATAGSHVAVLWIAIALFDLDARPIRVELFGEDHGESGAHALAHLRAGNDEADIALR